ncbi:MAG TPA: GNAT family N-acetyltransferase [Flavipsychrobacter sp.]|nr:GNAT family N-acetyltransferase [Flavipsychrobacter sp.]
MNITIRSATIADLAVIYHFMCELKEKQLDFNRFKECLDINLQRQDAYHLVAEAEGKVVGFLSCYGQIVLHHCGMEYEIQEMYVDAEYRGKKIGQTLLQAIEERIGEYKSLKVCSNVRRKEAHRFYTSHDIEQTGYRFIKLGDA